MDLFVIVVAWFSVGIVTGELYARGARRQGRRTSALEYFFSVVFGPIFLLIMLLRALIGR